MKASNMRLSSAVLALCVGSVACGGPSGPAAPSAPASPSGNGVQSPSSGSKGVAGASDPLGPRPKVDGVPLYAPPTPQVFDGPQGMKVWLLERHTLPMVTMALGVAHGAYDDPTGKAGLAYATASMLEEGAGGRGALEFAKAMETLGASFQARATMDGSLVSLQVLKDKWDPALALAADAVTKPRFEAKEWKRFHTLWTNELKNRSSEPRAVLQVLARSVLFGKDSPAGHPVDGFRDSADKVTLEDVRKAYQSHFRPEETRVVFVGDITKDEALQALNRHFGSWRPAPAPKTEPAKVVGGSVESFPLVMVDRPDAPQAVIAWAKVGIPITHAELAPLERSNTALGGSFTSRLNMDLREERGWSYGAHSRVSADRVTGILMASAAVFADKTAPALEALAGDIEVFATKGLTDVEAQRTQFQARAERVAAYESNDTIADILILDALRDLGPTFQATFAESTDKATKVDLDRMAKNYFQKAGATLMVVGPKAQVVPQLVAMGMPEPVFFDEEGRRKGPKSGEP